MKRVDRLIVSQSLIEKAMNLLHDIDDVLPDDYNTLLSTIDSPATARAQDCLEYLENRVYDNIEYLQSCD